MESEMASILEKAASTPSGGPSPHPMGRGWSIAEGRSLKEPSVFVNFVNSRENAQEPDALQEETAATEILCELRYLLVQPSFFDTRAGANPASAIGGWAE
jgi:hypothetical protein